MIPWLSASLLAGSVLSCAECTFIILMCGPFWVGPELFIRTWLLYSVASASFLFLANPLLARLPWAQRFLTTPRRRFFANYSLAWIVTSALLVALVAYDCYLDSQYPLLALSAALIGILTLLLLRLTVQNSRQMLIISITWSFMLQLATVGVDLASDRYWAASVKSRSAEFKGGAAHVLLLVMDTVRSDHLSCYGYPFPTSPNLDQLAQEGLLCRNAYSAANWTPPGHISIFTGKYPAQHGNDGQAYMPDDLVSIPEILNRQGYFNVALYNNHVAGRNMNLTQGFDLDLGVYGHRWIYPAPFRIRDKLGYGDSGSKITFFVAEKIFNWMEKHDGHLFLFVNICEAHSPYQIHQPYFSQFAAGPEASNPSQVKNLRDNLYPIKNDSSRFAGLTDADYAYLRAVYDSEIAYADHYLGQFTQALRRNQMLDQVLLVATSDHGELLGEHWTLGHPELLFNPVLRVPLVIRFPQRISPQVLTENVSTVDILPTLLNLLDLPLDIPDGVQGLDILSGSLPDDRALLSIKINPEGGCYSIIQAGRKLIVNQDPQQAQLFPADSLLFNLRSDPYELTNLLEADQGGGDSLGQYLSTWLDEITVRPRTEIQISRTAVANMKSLGYVH